MENQESIKLKINFLLSNNKLENAIEQLKILSTNEEYEKDKIILFENKLASINESFDLETISREKYQREKNKLILAISNYTKKEKKKKNHDLVKIENEGRIDQYLEFKLKGDKNLNQAYKLMRNGLEKHSRKKLLQNAISNYKLYLKKENDILGYLNLSKAYKLLYLNSLESKFDPEIKDELRKTLKKSKEVDKEGVFKYQCDQIAKDVSFIERYRLFVILIPAIIILIAFTVPFFRDQEGLLMDGRDIIGIFGLLSGVVLYFIIKDRRNI